MRYQTKTAIISFLWVLGCALAYQYWHWSASACSIMAIPGAFIFFLNI